ncbi:MAG: hypothetical protein K6C34_04780 [Alphaproteobacteria bacterium]|nr:hypothetical protein [Alphaproteobacteria bacterium]
MTFFISSGNLLQTYIFWELLSVVSYFLIAFDKKPESLHAAFRTITMHKFGDIGFIISMILIFNIFGSLNFSEITKNISSIDANKTSIATLAILISVFIKSAQIGATSWLKNAMKAPMPASALIHSSTLVTAGIFVLIRLHSLFDINSSAQTLIVLMGCSSALLCAIRAIFSDNIKLILAYSTCSQVGIMLIACGFSSYCAAVILFVAHAFTKSLLFFSSGSVVSALSGEQNIEKMGALFESLPVTYIAFITATISTIGVPLLSYYYAKKALLYSIATQPSLLRDFAIFILILTSIAASVYLFRVIYHVFHGQSKLNEISLAYANENSSFIIKPLFFSMFFSVIAGILFYYGAYDNVFWKGIFPVIDTSNTSILLLYSIANAAGIIAAFFICKKIKTHNWSLEYFFNIDSEAEKLCFKSVQLLDANLYRRCFLYFSNRTHFVLNDKNCLICFLFLVLFYLTHWIK